LEVHFSSHLSAQSVPEHTAISPTLRNRARRAAGRSSTAAKNMIPPRSPHPQAVGTPGKKPRRAGITSGLARYDVATAATGHPRQIDDVRGMSTVTPIAAECALLSPGTPGQVRQWPPIAPIASLARAPENGCNTEVAGGTCRSPVNHKQRGCPRRASKKHRAMMLKAERTPRRGHPRRLLPSHQQTTNERLACINSELSFYSRYFAAAAATPAWGQTLVPAAGSGIENQRAGGGWTADPNYKGKGLQLHFTVADEGVFTMPWSATKTYRRPLLTEWQEVVCAENLHEYYAGKDTEVPRADKPGF
jgi:hypothetical protein